MTTLEASRRAARPRQRYMPRLLELSLWCLRCDRPFKSPVLVRECHDCNRASERVYGMGCPTWEMSGM